VFSKLGSRVNIGIYALKYFEFDAYLSIAMPCFLSLGCLLAMKLRILETCVVK
jgi:hypothetical protein